ncbi:MAG: Hpt domain-containing protein [Eubacteriales bacterium]|nr:Hpt domain-containing protein [Eubacteriales bacterium]
MTVKECYEAIGGSYDGVMSRLPSEALVKRFLLKFVNDKSFDELTAALEAENVEDAFRAAHTLKGVCGNLSLDKLGASSIAITEELRAGNLEAAKPMYPEVAANYKMTVDAINQIS